MTDTIFTNPFGTFTLNRFPGNEHDSLRAWDAADEYIISHLFEKKLVEPLNILIIHESFGALTLPLCTKHKVTVVTDSAVNVEGLYRNMDANKLDRSLIQIKTISDIEELKADLILFKLPKNQALIEWELDLLSHKNEGKEIIAAGMVKYMNSALYKMLEDTMGDYHSSLAKKKARLLMGQIVKSKNPNPEKYNRTYPVANMPEPLNSNPALFSWKKLDNGTEMMLHHMRIPRDPVTIVDFGCGNGVLGIKAALINQEAKIIGIDESFKAIETAKSNAKKMGLEDRMDFRVGWDLSVLTEPVDVIITNPPNHTGQIVSQSTSDQLITDSLDKLNDGGGLILVANSYLGYQKQMSKVFGNCKILSKNKIYMVLRSMKK